MAFNQEKINKDLAENDSSSSEFQKKLLEIVRPRIKASSDRMCQFHAAWDNNEYIYRGYRSLDRDDKDAIKDGEPNKIIVPITYAQAQTALSFLFSTFTSNENLFQLQPIGPEDSKLVFGVERDLAYQARSDKLMLKVYYWALDAIKQGFGVVKNEWVEDKQQMRTAATQPVRSMGNFFGQMFGQAAETEVVEQIQEVLTYQGNRTTNISPYCFYPDPSCSIARFQEGEFCAHEEDVALSALKAEEGKKYFGTSKIPSSITKELFDTRARRARGPFAGKDDEGTRPYKGNKTESQLTVLTEMEVRLNPRTIKKELKLDLGDEDYMCIFLITVANDQKVIRCEKWGYFHNNFGYNLVEFSPDHGSFYNAGLADTIFELQNIVTFFLNSHIVNVRKIIANRFIVDPSKIEMDDIKAGSMFIRTKGGAAQIERAIHQLEVSDITRNNVADMSAVMNMIQQVTGISDNALGQYASGRRSATEAKNVSAGSAARLKMTAQLMWMQGIDPLGRQWLANTRQWRDREIYEQIVGKEVVDAPYDLAILADPGRIAGGYDFMPFDPTMPSDRQFQGNILKELFSMLVSKPETMQLVNKNPMLLLEHIAKLFGIRDLKEYDLQPLVPPVAQVVPDEVAGQMANDGAEEVDMTGQGVLDQLSQ